MPSCYNRIKDFLIILSIIIVRALGTGFLHVLSPLNQLDFGACAYRMTSSPILPRPSKTLSLALDNCVQMSISSTNGNRSIFQRVQTPKAHAQRSPFRVSFRSILRLPQTSAALSAVYSVWRGWFTPHPTRIFSSPRFYSALISPLFRLIIRHCILCLSLGSWTDKRTFSEIIEYIS